MQYLILEMRDADDQNLIRIFPQFVSTSRTFTGVSLILPCDRTQSFIDGALAAGGKVLVHCGDGISRSPAVV